MNGMTVGFIANQTNDETQGRFTVKGLTKASEFVTFCDAFGLPVVTVSDVVGYATKLSEEKIGLAKALTQPLVFDRIPVA